MVRRFATTMLLAAAATLTTVPGVAGAALRAEHDRLNVGEVKAGAEAVATFVLHNDGARDIKILRAKPS